MYNDILTKTGLNKNEAVIYDFLLQKGEISAGEIIKNTPLKRGTVYNALASLAEKELISEKKKQKIAYFSPNHPEKLREYLENQKLSLKKAENELESNITNIISQFNLISEKPGVKYFEGINGLKKVLADILTSKETVNTFADVETIVKYMEKLNTEHAKKREELGLNKKIIVTDTDFAKNYLKNYHPKTTEFKYIDHQSYPIGSIVEIYDGKVAYISLSEKGIISMIITDHNIYQFNRSLFKFAWERAQKF